MSANGHVFRGLAFAAIVLILGCNRESFEQRTARENAARKEEAQRYDEIRRAAVRELAGQYNADVSWSDKSFGLTIDVQERLIRADHRPVAGIARLVDVERDGSAYLLHLVYENGLHPTLELVLRTSEQAPRPPGANSLMGETWAAMTAPSYVFVADIRRVQRRDRLRADSDSLDRHRFWIVEGECLALRQLPPASRTSSERRIDREDLDRILRGMNR